MALNVYSCTTQALVKPAREKIRINQHEDQRAVSGRKVSLYDRGVQSYPERSAVGGGFCSTQAEAKSEPTESQA